MTTGMSDSPTSTARTVRLAGLCLLLLHPLVGFAWLGAPTPHDNAHLLVLPHGRFQGPDGARPTPVKDEAALLGGAAAPLTAPLAAQVRVRFVGRYFLWLRLGQPRRPFRPVKLRLVDTDGRAVLQGQVNDGPGSVERGGPEAYSPYRTEALTRTPDGKSSGMAAGPEMMHSEDAAAIEDALMADFSQPGEIWANMTRLERLDEKRPYYWWRAGAAELQAGDYRLHLEPAAPLPKGAEPLLDVAFLTTYERLIYPFTGDFTAPPASYIRCRIDEAPADGLTIGARLRIHGDPWFTPGVSLNPDGLSELGAKAHKRSGYTRWYRLQDIEYAPRFGGGLAHLHLSVKGAGKNPRGLTQFAVLPHRDHVLREIAWDEPDGVNISMRMDFKTHLDKLRTFRDHARENYRMALRATEGRLFPLTRGPLYFTNGWGAATGAAQEYMAKTLRLLGFNSASVAGDAVKLRRLYGWHSHAGHYWPPVYLPFDEADSVRRYDKHYRAYFSRNRELYEDVATFQIADEPGEIARGEMTAPLWRFYPDDDGPGRWVDHPGGSNLHTRRTDVGNCVLEGKVDKMGRWIGFRVGIDNAEKPTKYAYWRVGRVSPSLQMNFAAGKVGLKTGGGGVMKRAGAAVGRGTRFKIVYEEGEAALYLNDKLIHRHVGLPLRGALGIEGPPKAVRELRLRQIANDEHIVVKIPGKDLAAGGEDDVLAELDDLGLEQETPEWAEPKPLESFVKEECVPSGGMPKAHVAFRQWAAAKGLSPQLFGKEEWDQVRMLTLPVLVKTPEEARLFYWSRRYSGYLTPRTFSLAAQAIGKHSPNHDIRGFVALSGHSLYMRERSMPLDMFQLGSEGGNLVAGISDWMSMGGWRWDSHQAVAFSIAPYNAGARRFGREPASYPMMHCVWPSVFRSYTMLANQTRIISYWTYGPVYAVTEGYWSPSYGGYAATNLTNNRAALVDDVLAHATIRPSRVAMLYTRSNEYWAPHTSFSDKRAAFLAMAHEYYRPELVNEEQIMAGALEHYDALYAFDPLVATAAQERIGAWVRDGGMLWACADAMTRNEYNEPQDFLASAVSLRREFTEPDAAKKPPPRRVAPAKGDSFRPYTVARQGAPAAVEAPAESRVRARYEDGQTAWLELGLGRGRVHYVAHRAGLTYTGKAIRLGGSAVVWSDTGRALLTAPLHEAKVERELILSQPLVVASALSTDSGTLIILYNMQGAPATDLEVSLREPAAPHSVELFEGMDLQPLAHEYKDGRVTMRLPVLSGGQMILLRRQAAPPDDRLARMRQRTVRQLESPDWRTLSAATWFAGFFPDWQLAEKLTPQLQHQRWEVRRSAAEALGRLGHAASGPLLEAALAREEDAHCVAEMVLAAAKLGLPKAPEICLRAAAHGDAFVRYQALSALGQLLAGAGAAKARAAAAQAAAKCLDDADWRARGAAIELAVALDPRQALATAVADLAGERQSRHQKAWLGAVTGNEAAYREYLRQDMPGGDRMLLAFAVARTAPELAAAVAALLDELLEKDAAGVRRAAGRQHEAALTKLLLGRREKLPKSFGNRLPLLLERTFNARLGWDFEAWDELAKGVGDGGKR